MKHVRGNDMAWKRAARNAMEPGMKGLLDCPLLERMDSDQEEVGSCDQVVFDGDRGPGGATGVSRKSRHCRQEREVRKEKEQSLLKEVHSL